MAVNFKLFCILFSFITICQAQISFRKDSGAVFLRYNGQDVINLSAADKEVLVQGERFRYFGNFIIVRRVNNAFKRIINQLNSLGLSFDGTTVQIVTRTQPDIFGPGVLYIHQSAGVTFYTNNSNLIQRISDALNNPGGLPTPPPEEGDWSSWGSWSSCSATCGSGFRTRRRQCEGCQEDCCVCPPGATFQIEECLQLSCKGQWSGWSSWSSCSLSCGGGFRTRMRQCAGQGECFPGKSFQHQQCNSQNCCT